MPRNVDYGEAIAILQINQKLKEDWKRRDADTDLDGTSSRLTVRNLEHAQALVVSCAKIWAEYEQENALRGPKRGRRPGSGFKNLLEDLNKVIEAKPDPKQYTSSDVAAELEERTQGNKEVRQQKEEAKERRRRRPKGTLEVYKSESHQAFGDVNLRVAIPIEYGEWTTGQCAFTVRMAGQLVMGGEGESRDEAWADLCQKMTAKLDELVTKFEDDDEGDTRDEAGESDEDLSTEYESDEDLGTEEVQFAWLYGLVREEPVPDEHKKQWESMQTL